MRDASGMKYELGSKSLCVITPTSPSLLFYSN